mmetsp:Transcript_99262/g.289668  ORF Transcript_99262/g.289668 Transcript_99262/m.289668 type:complete len:200 (+) Transcript_99262:334-933(+)
MRPPTVCHLPAHRPPDGDGRKALGRAAVGRPLGPAPAGYLAPRHQAREPPLHRCRRAQDRRLRLVRRVVFRTLQFGRHAAVHGTGGPGWQGCADRGRGRLERRRHGAAAPHGAPTAHHVPRPRRHRHERHGAPPGHTGEDDAAADRDPRALPVAGGWAPLVLVAHVLGLPPHDGRPGGRRPRHGPRGFGPPLALGGSAL